jgi:hypothetical protein
LFDRLPSRLHEFQAGGYRRLTLQPFSLKIAANETGAKNNSP